MLDRFYIFLMFIPLVSLHEAAHAAAAYLLGDDTAEQEGRLTLDPLQHIDIFGTLIVPALNILILSGGLLGWGRPVPVNPANLRHWRRDEILIALAGPAANLLFGLVVAMLVVWGIPDHSPWQKLAALFAYVSIFLALLNLIPIPPFDGWSLLKNLFDIPTEWLEKTSLWWTLAILAILNFTPLLQYLDMSAERILAGMELLCSGGRMLS